MTYTLGHVLVFLVIVIGPIVLAVAGLVWLAIALPVGYAAYDLTGEIKKDIATWRAIRRLDGMFR